MEALYRPLFRAKSVLLRGRIALWLAPLIVCVASLAAARGLWISYSPNWRQLWTDVVHDRNAHLEYGLGCASDLVHFHFDELVRDVDRSRTWPPLHEGLMVGLAVLLGGIDPRLAVLPSLTCYTGAAMLAFLLARRLLDNGGTAAGAIASILVLVSPAMRAFAVDVMVEMPGACLTLFALYAAVRVKQENSIDEWRLFAMSLTSLFFVKYNYWLLVMLALAPMWWQWLATTLPQFKSMACGQFAKTQLQQPLNWLIAISAAVAFWMKLSGQPMSLIIAAVWWAILFRAVVWYLGGGRDKLAAQPRLAALIHWHAIPCALWLAWPGKLASFLWVLWPGTNVGEFPAQDRWDGIRYYLNAATTDYHIAIWSAVAVAILVAIGITACLSRRRRPGAIFVVALVIIAAMLTAPHPNRKSRYLHSWLPAAWVLAGVGAGSLAAVDRRLGIGVGGLLVTLHLPSITAAAHAPEGGLQPDRPCALELAADYLPLLADAKYPAVLSNVPMRFFTRWTYLEAYGRSQRLLTEVPGFDPRGPSDANAAAFRNWLATTKCDAIVLIHLPPTSPWYVPVPNHAGLEHLIGLTEKSGPSMIQEAGPFMPIHIHRFADRGGAVVKVWRRAPG